MIIVTGVDNTGKTSLVEHLKEQFNLPIASKYHTLPPMDYNDWVQWAVCRFEDPREALYDRFFIDELVYGPVMRGRYGASIEHMALLSTMFVMKQPFFIYTKLPKEKILEKFQVREQYPRDHDIGKLLRQFERVMKSWPVNQLKNVTRFDYTSDPDYKRIDRVVLNYLTGGSI